MCVCVCGSARKVLVHMVYGNAIAPVPRSVYSPMNATPCPGDSPGSSSRCMKNGFGSTFVETALVGVSLIYGVYEVHLVNESES